MATKKTPLSPIKVKAVLKPLDAKKAEIKKMPAAAAKAPAKVSKKAIAKSVDMDVMFDLAAETFRVMSAPMRLKIINCLCSEEKNVGQLLDEINTTQPNMSQHLNTLFKAKILGRRREGVQIYYRIINERVVTLCRAVCTQIAIDSDIEHV
jgi:DNA-binding transcriptional ArsR family regulator